MTEGTYSDNDVIEAIQGMKNFFGWASTIQHENDGLWTEEQKMIIWAAEQYLKAKPVIEWYGDLNNYANGECCDLENINHDSGKRAQEFLNQIKS